MAATFDPLPGVSMSLLLATQARFLDHFSYGSLRMRRPNTIPVVSVAQESLAIEALAQSNRQPLARLPTWKVSATHNSAFVGDVPRLHRSCKTRTRAP